jgi:hypothetical protein
VPNGYVLNSSPLVGIMEKKRMILMMYRKTYDIR